MKNIFDILKELGLKFLKTRKKILIQLLMKIIKTLMKLKKLVMI